MLNLQPRIHFEEIKAAILACDKLNRAGAVVAHGLGKRDRLLAHLLSRGRIEQRRWRLLDDLLVAALDRAFALAKVDNVAVFVAQHLDFDVARIDDKLLDEHAVVAKRRLRLRAGAGEALGDLGLGIGDAHALAAAAGGGLNHHWITNLFSDPDRLGLALNDAEMAWHSRHLGLGGGLLGFDLVAHGGNRRRLRPDEDDAGLFQRFGKRLTLGEKTVARMHRLGLGPACGLDDLVDDQIAFGRSRWPDQHRLVSHLDVQRVAVGLGIDRDRLDAHPPRGLCDPAGDFAAIGDENTLEHAAQVSVLRQGCGSDRQSQRQGVDKSLCRRYECHPRRGARPRGLGMASEIP